MKKTISLDDKIHTSRVLIELFLLMKISSYFSDQIILLIISNICIFYSILDKKYPHFLFMFRMSIKQIIEGTIGILICFLPSCQKDKNKNNNNNNNKDKKEKTN